MLLSIRFWAGGNAIGPQMFLANDGPRYLKAWTSHIVVYAVQCATIVFLRIYLMRQNALKRRAASGAEAIADGAEHNAGSSLAFNDLTDRENPECEYHLYTILNFETNGPALHSPLCILKSIIHDHLSVSVR
jgi:hypothetical protein